MKLQSAVVVVSALCGAATGAVTSSAFSGDQVVTKSIVIQDTEGRTIAKFGSDLGGGDVGIVMYDRNGNVAVHLGCGSAKPKGGGKDLAVPAQQSESWSLLHLESESKTDSKWSAATLAASPTDSCMYLSQGDGGIIMMQSNSARTGIDFNDMSNEDRENPSTLTIGLEGKKAVIVGRDHLNREKQTFSLP